MFETTAHNDHQRRYFQREPGGNVRIEPTHSPYVERHVERTLAALAWRPGQRVLEVGAGLGRFTSLMLARGLSVVASDLSPELLAELTQRHPGLRTMACDVAEVAFHTERPFERAVGFFMLHHLVNFDRVFSGLRRALAPGAKIAFCEPNAFHVPYYLQIAFSRHMTFEGDGGVRHMRPAVILPSLERAGFRDVMVERYGFTPPMLYNRKLGRGLDRLFEGVPALEPLRAFQIFSASVP